MSLTTSSTLAIAASIVDTLDLEDEVVLELISEMFNLQEDLALENMVEEIIEEDIRQSV